MWCNVQADESRKEMDVARERKHAGSLEWLPEARSGVSQGQFAKRLGMRQPTLSRHENGQGASRELVTQVAKELGMEPDLALLKSGYIPDWLLRALIENPELLGQLKNRRG